MHAIMIGLGIAKTTFHAFGQDAEGKPVLDKRLGRASVGAFFAKLPPAVVAMEACASAPSWPTACAGLPALAGGGAEPALELLHRQPF